MVTPMKFTGPPLPAESPGAGLYCSEGPIELLPAGQFRIQKRDVVAPPAIVSVALKLAVLAVVAEVQLIARDCSVVVPTAKLRVAVLTEKFAASVPDKTKLPKVLVPCPLPPLGVTTI